MDKKYIIYRAYNRKGKSYVGCTGETLWIRFSRHQNERKTKKKIFYKALNKYIFCWEILEVVYEKDKMFELEKFYIKKYDSKIPNGYNQTDGGEGAPGLKRSEKEIKIIKERCSIKIIRNDNKIYNSYTEAAVDIKDFAANISAAVSGKRRTVKGFTFKRVDGKFDEDREVLISKKKLIKELEKKPVIDELEIIYESISEEARQLDVDPSNVCRVARGRRKSIKGKIFKYYKE